MNEIDGSDEGFPFQFTPQQNIHFVQNETGTREAKELSDEEIQEVKAKKEIPILIVDHIGHTKLEMIELLNSHNLPKGSGEIVVIENIPSTIAPEMIEGRTEDIHQMIITMRPDMDIPDTVLIPEHKAPGGNFSNHYVPKIRKSQKKVVKRYHQRKK